MQYVLNSYIMIQHMTASLSVQTNTTLFFYRFPSTVAFNGRPFPSNSIQFLPGLHLKMKVLYKNWYTNIVLFQIDTQIK